MSAAQLNFLDDRERPVYSPALARRSDPETSHLAASQVALTENQMEFMAAMRRCGYPCTAAEIADHAAEGFNRESVRKRAAELLRQGLIAVYSARPCRLTGKVARTFYFKGWTK